MERGYIKLWRKSLDSRVWASPELWQLWTWCLMRANHKKRYVPFKTGKGGVSVEVEKGQFVWGRLSCAEAFGWVPSTAKKRMDKLVEFGCIKIESNSQYSIVTICNWENYQPDKEEEVTPKEHPSDSQVTPKEHPSDTDKKLKELRELEELNRIRSAEAKQRKADLLSKANSVIDYLNEKAGRSFKHTATNQKNIMGRFKEGFTVEDCKTVIDVKCSKWLGDPSMESYLRPLTLFAGKFESYLQESKPTQLPQTDAAEQTRIMLAEKLA